MKLICIDDSDNQHLLFFGKWISCGTEYEGEVVQSPCDKQTIVVLSDVPGKRMIRKFCKCGKCVYGFRPDRFVQSEVNVYRDEALLATVV